MGLKDVTRISDIAIEAKEESKLKEQKILFVLTLSELNSKVQSIDTRIKQAKGKYDQIYVITSNKKLSNYFRKWLSNENVETKLEFWNRDELIVKIDEYYEDFWSHNDTFLKPFESAFHEVVKKDNQLKSLLKLDDKFDKLFEVFIEPKLYVQKDDNETDAPTKVRINKEKIVKSGNYIISGEAGTGKSTLLKELGKGLIERNRELLFKNVPIYIKPNNLLEEKFNLEDTIHKILLKTYKEFDIEKIFKDYQLILLLDSIDEFDRKNQITILNQIQDLKAISNIRYIIGTRNYNYLVEDCNLDNYVRVNLNNFDLKQVKLFLDNIFKFDLAKSDKLWNSLQDNNILEKIPITPLTVSLISILFEEKQYEIPATITDIYDNFNLFLLGRTSVKSSLEFLDITIKERILSMYALEIIEDENNEKKTISEFEVYIKGFFSSKNITVKDEVLPELIKSLTEGTGVLYKDENERIDFKHDYFMEYYASREIFNQRRDLEPMLIENFTKFSWQNTAIFYTGRTKDMPAFLEDLIARVAKYTDLKDELIATSGMGYILQSLWLTDSKIRKDGVISALELLIKADQDVKRLSSTVSVFNGIRDIDVALLNFFWFFSHFNSKTLEDTLKLAFHKLSSDLDKIHDTSKSTDITNLHYKLFCIGATLTSDRFEKNDKLDLLFARKDVLSNPMFVLLFDSGLDIIDPNNKDEVKDRFKLKSKLIRMQKGIRYYLDNSVDVTRFTSLETIRPIKKVEIFTEGKTDAIYIMHAFKVLTNNSEPYWNIESCEIKSNKTSGGSHELTKTLKTFNSEIDSGKHIDKTIIGIYDHDSAGFQEFNGLKKEEYDTIKEGLVKKHKTKDIYAIVLPIPDSLTKYKQERQEFKFFEIEHYFSEDLLKENGMVKELEIKGLYEITGDKAKFASIMKDELNHEIFSEFENLFLLLDDLNQQKLEYF